jgi:hypothetical protein
MKNSYTPASTDSGFLGMLFLLFLGLRIAGIIDWPWVWVFAPIWIPLALVALVVFAAVLHGWLAR